MRACDPGSLGPLDSSWTDDVDRDEGNGIAATPRKWMRLTAGQLRRGA